MTFENINTEVEMQDYIRARKDAYLKLIADEKVRVARDEIIRKDASDSITKSKAKIIRWESDLFKLDKGIIPPEMAEDPFDE